jgi:glycosyltransferase involved in cell wall biosynthesis
MPKSKSKRKNKPYKGNTNTSRTIKNMTENTKFVSLTNQQSISLCLVMIVKDEGDKIRRCLTAVAPYISYWVIVDTGSKDDTLDEIRSTMDELGIPGELHERPWVNFEVNRTESLEFAKGRCDYRWIIDADDLFIPDNINVNPFAVIQNKDVDSFHLSYKLSSLQYYRAQIVRSDQDWVYKGVLHEYLHCDKPNLIQSQITGCHVKADISPLKRAATVQEKYAKDAEILRVALEKEPDNTRYMFYLAQSYRDSDQPEKSIEAYQMRVDAGGWPEEVYYSLYMMGRLKERLQRPIEEIMDAYRKAWEYRPSRFEALFHLLRLLRQSSRWFPMLVYAEKALQIGHADQDILFVEPDVAKWRLKDEYSLALYFTGRPDLAKNVMQPVIENQDLLQSIHEQERARILKNFSSFVSAAEDREKRMNGGV